VVNNTLADHSSMRALKFSSRCTNSVRYCKDPDIVRRFSIGVDKLSIPESLEVRWSLKHDDDVQTGASCGRFVAGAGYRREMTSEPVTGTRTHVVSGHVNSGGFNTTAWFPTGQCIPDEVAPSVTRGSASASDVNAPAGSPGVEVTERKTSYPRQRAICSRDARQIFQQTTPAGSGLLPTNGISRTCELPSPASATTKSDMKCKLGVRDADPRWCRYHCRRSTRDDGYSPLSHSSTHDMSAHKNTEEIPLCRSGHKTMKNLLRTGATCMKYSVGSTSRGGINTCSTHR